jgi:two-component system, NarL family, response regulator NreC
MPPYKIILADDHVMMREGLKRLIQEDPAMQVIDEAADGLELLEILERSTPDMVIIDINMPRLRGLEATKFIKELYPEVKVLILTMNKSKEVVYHAMNIGANGYLLKEDAHEVLRLAIESIRRGENFISPLIFE